MMFLKEMNHFYIRGIILKHHVIVTKNDIDLFGLANRERNKRE
jgi:hypothetical protein